MLQVVILAFLVALPLHVAANDPLEIGRLILKLDDNDKQKRIDAAESLAEVVDGKIPKAVRKRIEVEDDFHVKLALHYALAAQGEKQALKFLIDSLEKSGHLGYVYLRDVTDQDFGWNIAWYRNWFSKTSDEEFQSFINKRWKRKPMMDEWGEFLSLYTRSYFSSLTDAETGQPIDPNKRMSDEETKRLNELPTAKAWELFEGAINQLQENGNRKEAARMFREVAKDYSNTYYAEKSNELADLLDKMIEEDMKYKAPKNVEALNTKDEIAYHIHNLRDVVAYQYSQPGRCSVLSRPLFAEEDSYNAAIALRRIGRPALPFLIELLNDRRPIRAVGFWRIFHPTRSVLRYQDAADQIIHEILYDQPSPRSYFSNEPPEMQKSIINSYRISANVN